MTKTSLITGKILERLNLAGIKPRKRLGQNFLVNERVYRRIIEEARIRPSDIVVEVGAGLGTLTDYLAGLAGKVIAIEKDKILAVYLRDRFSDNKNVTIVEDDILKFKIENLPDSQAGLKLKIYEYKLVGNIPYYLTSRLIRKVFEEWPSPKLIIFILQKEVAQRIVASPPNMSLLAVSVQYYAKPEIVSYVSKGSFWPQPKVDSAIIKLVSSDQFLASSDEAENWKLETRNFFKVVRAGFAGKRKQLSNNLAKNLNLNKSKVQEKLLLSAIAPSRRAETLTVQEWKKIAGILG